MSVRLVVLKESGGRDESRLYIITVRSTGVNKVQPVITLRLTSSLFLCENLVILCLSLSGKNHFRGEKTQISCLDPCCSSYLYLQQLMLMFSKLYDPNIQSLSLAILSLFILAAGPTFAPMRSFISGYF